MAVYLRSKNCRQHVVDCKAFAACERQARRHPLWGDMDKARVTIESKREQQQTTMETTTNLQQTTLFLLLL